jgi:PAS domain S-box-containing protein
MLQHLKYFCLILAVFIVSIVHAQRVTLQLKWKHQFQFAGYYAAIEKGYYKEAGLEVLLKEAVVGENPVDAVLSGQAEFGITTTDILLSRSAKRKPVVLATIFQHSPLVLLASKQSGIQNVHDLLGKRVAMEPNAADIIVYLADEGVQLSDFTSVHHSFDINNLLKGEVDAVSAYLTDELFIIRESGFEYTVLSPNSAGIDFYGDLLFTTDSLIIHHPKLVSKFRDASLKGWLYALNNQQEIIDLIYNKYSKRHSIGHLQFEAAQTYKLILPGVVEIGYTNPGRWKSIAETYKKVNLLNDSFTTDGLFYSDFIQPKSTIPLKLLLPLLLIVILAATVAFIFFKISRKLQREIRNRILAEHEIRKLSVAIEQSPTTIVITDLSGTIEYVNPKFEELTGYSSEEAIGRKINILESGKTDASVYSDLWKTITSGKIWQGEFINKKKNGGEFIEDAVISPIFDNKGNIVNYIAIKQDITVKKQLTTELKNNELKLIELNATKDRFISILAHDLRSPFNALIGFSEILQAEIKSGETNIGEYVDIIEKTSRNTYYLLENLLQWARSQQNVISFNPEKIGISEIIEECVNLTRSNAHSKKIEIEIKSTEDVNVYADKEMVKTILRNLLSNAIKFTPVFGKITISCALNQPFVEISVSDTGVGMDEKAMESLFKIGRVVSTNGTEGEHGTGFGLLLCKDFVEKHGGTIRVESKPGKGSVFKFNLPLNSD